MATDTAFELGIMAGLVSGKHLGVAAFTFTALMLGLCQPPQDLNQKTRSWRGTIG